MVVSGSLRLSQHAYLPFLPKGVAGSSMQLPKALATAALLGCSLAAFGQASLSDDTVNVLHAAMTQAEHGEIARAQAALGSLLMPRGLSVGMESPGAMSRAVQHGVQIWGERLEDSPFHYTSSRNADIKVRFVDAIHGEGDLQGQVRLHRYVRWGSGGASYHIT